LRTFIPSILSPASDVDESVLVAQVLSILEAQKQRLIRLQTSNIPGITIDQKVIESIEEAISRYATRAAIK
jgi:hypothetical protein